jgi:hypothetical protein
MSAKGDTFHGPIRWLPEDPISGSILGALEIIPGKSCVYLSVRVPLSCRVTGLSDTEARVFTFPVCRHSSIEDHWVCWN